MLVNLYVNFSPFEYEVRGFEYEVRGCTFIAYIFVT